MENKKCYVDLSLLNNVLSYLYDIDCYTTNFDPTGRKLNKLCRELVSVIQTTSDVKYIRVVKRSVLTVTVQSNDEAECQIFTEYLHTANFE